MLLNLVSIQDIFDPSVLWFTFAIASFVFFLLGLIFRIVKLRSASRILLVIGSVFLVVYAGLTFIDLSNTILNGDWTLKDVGDIIFFVTTVIIFIINLGMAIRKK